MTSALSAAAKPQYLRDTAPSRLRWEEADVPGNRLLDILYVVVNNARKQRSHACKLIFTIASVLRYYTRICVILPDRQAYIVRKWDEAARHKLHGGT